MTHSDLECRSRSKIHTTKLWRWVGNIHAKHEDPSFILTRDTMYNVQSDQLPINYNDIESKSRSTKS
jgi:hypothetical protein